MTPSKERAIAALLTKPTKRQAAKAAGITDRTLARYFEDPEFVLSYRNAFRGVVEDAARQAQQSLTPALSTLREIMEDREENAGTRIQAAKATLEYAVKFTEQLDILEQLRELEDES